MSIELNDIAGSGISKINQNFQKIEDWINLNALWRDSVPDGQANQMEQNLDMNGYSIINASFDPEDPDSFLTLSNADALYINASGDTMQGPLNVRVPQLNSEPARKDQLDTERAQRQSNDANLQTQITQAAPMAAAERPVIQWHNNTLNTSTNIPSNVNAFSAGPVLTIADGVVVTVGDNSFWTIMTGEVNNG